MGFNYVLELLVSFGSVFQWSVSVATGDSQPWRLCLYCSVSGLIIVQYFSCTKLTSGMHVLYCTTHNTTVM